MVEDWLSNAYEGMSRRQFRRLSAQLPARCSQGRLGPLRCVVRQVSQRVESATSGWIKEQCVRIISCR